MMATFAYIGSRLMAIDFIPIHLVKSMSQRTLVNEWSRLSGKRRFPPIAEFKLDTRAHDPHQLVVWTVGTDNGLRKFQTRYVGKHATEASELASAGKTMDEIAPEPLKQFALETTNECATSGCAVYTILSTLDASGNQVDLERLLLPFGRDDSLVEVILASLQLISFKGAVDRRNVVREFETQSRVSLAGRIGSLSAQHTVGGA